MPLLTRRTQLLLDDDLHRRLRETAAQRGISIGALIREAIDEKLSSVADSRAQAIQELLSAEPIPFDEDWPVLKRQMIEERHSAVASFYENDDD